MSKARDIADIVGGGFAIPAGSLGNAVPADGSITTAKLADGAVHTAKIADDAIHTAKIADDAVVQNSISNGEVTPAKLSDTLDLSTKSVTLASGVGGADWTSSIQTTDFTAVNAKGYWVNTTSNSVTVTLPSSPSQGDYVIIKDYAGTANTNNILIRSTDTDIQGQSGTWDHIISASDAALELRFIDTTRGWVAVSSANEGSTKTITSQQPTYNIGYYIVSGGGSGTVGGGYEAGGGGGAGGRLQNTGASFTVAETNVYTIEIGAGATHGARQAGTSGASGSQSKIKLGSTNLFAPNGGGGARQSNNGLSGGSGGGGSAGNGGRSGGSGTSGQGNNGGSGVSGNSRTAGGGGGVAGNGGTSGGGAAENNAWETGSNQKYAGGGGGANSGSGGSGVGGNGSNSDNSGAGNGVANTGSGGGGRHSGDSYPNSAVGGHGGSGVCILKVPTAEYSGTTTGSPIVRVAGSWTYLTYKQSGTYTA
jgi:hypothetical protein